MHMQDSDCWMACTYNSIPGCGHLELEKKAIEVMNAFRRLGNDRVTFVKNEPSAVACLKRTV